MIFAALRRAGPHLAARFSEWVFACQLAVFASILLAPGDTFGSSHVYDYMASWASERRWGFVLATIAGLRLFALALNGNFSWFRPYSPAVRAITAWLSAGAWGALTLGMFNGNINGTGWGIYGVLTLADTGLGIMIAGEAGPVFRRHMNARS